MAVQIQLRNGSASLWTSVNPTLAVGEVGVEVDTNRMKIGNGNQAWNSLSYTNSATASYVMSSSFALNAFIANLADTASFVTASNVFGTVNSSSFSVSASYAPGNPSISASYAASASFADFSLSSSYASTSSVAYELDGQVIPYVSGSNVTTTIQGAISTPLSFSMAPNEIWRFEAYVGAQCSGNAGTKYAISCSFPLRMVEAWVMGATNAITATTRQRLIARNTLQTTAVHTQGGVPADDRIWGLIMNFTSSNIVSIAFASTNAGQTSTVFVGSHMTARRVDTIT